MSNISHTKIVPHQYYWSKKFEEEKEKLQSIFGERALEIEHIGSTSIPGLSAKPIIDVAVMVEMSQDADSFTEPLAKAGYRFDSDSASTERHFYRKGEPAEYHLSVAYTDRGGFWVRQILFRNYLRNHSDSRDEYATLKAELLKNDPTGSGSYFGGKSEFVYKILNLAGWKENQKYSE